MPTDPSSRIAVPQEFPLIKRCRAAARNLADCFREFETWSKADLRGLLDEADALDGLIGDEWEKIALRPEYFWNAGSSKHLDNARFNVQCMLGEICSAAIYYLEASHAK